MAPSRGTDRLVRRLSLVRCRGAAHGAGWHGRTVLRVSMHAWNGERGVVLARRVVALRAQGCNVRVLAGVGFGRRVRSVLARGDVPLRQTGVAAATRTRS